MIGFIVLSIVFLFIGAVCVLTKAFESWESKATKIKRLILAVVLFFIACGGIVACNLLDGGGSKSSWDILSDDEKDWYRDNYGNGQYEQYQDAINDYKGY